MTEPPEELFDPRTGEPRPLGSSNEPYHTGIAGNMPPPPGAPGMPSYVDPASPRSSRSAVPIISTVVAAVMVGIGAVVAFLTLAPSATPPAAISITHSDGTVQTGVPFETRTAQEVYDTYIAMADDETIFEIIPQTDEGWDYFRAFMYKISDYKAAELFGPLDQEALQEMAALEQRFLALEDLELTVDITRTDGTRFVHDGKPPAPSSE